LDLGETDSPPAFAAQAGAIDILADNTGGPPYGVAPDRDPRNWERNFR
jgi:hypothetical protein